MYIRFTFKKESAFGNRRETVEVDRIHEPALKGVMELFGPREPGVALLPFRTISLDQIAQWEVLTPKTVRVISRVNGKLDAEDIVCGWYGMNDLGLAFYEFPESHQPFRVIPMGSFSGWSEVKTSEKD